MLFGRVDMIVDSTIIVDLIRGKEEAKSFIENQNEKLFISRAGAMEMLEGAKTKKDWKTIQKLLESLKIEAIEISESISKSAAGIFENFWHSHGIGVMDSFIAATALVLDEPLVTHNVKHFQFIKGLKIVIPY